MAKKVVASLKKGDSKNLFKVIQSVKSEKTGAYVFKARMMHSEAAERLVAEIDAS